jgi:transglutaminase-like putative cysteine protease
MSNAHLQETPLLDFKKPAIQAVITSRGWKTLAPAERIYVVHEFVKNEIIFGYNRSDDLSASEVMADGYGQCNTKATLMMALLRALDIPCRFHGFTIHKKVQSGIVSERLYHLSPTEILHSWVEVQHNDEWVPLEGFILDEAYLQQIKRLYSGRRGEFCGLGIATSQFENPPVRFEGRPTFIQSNAIVKDLGVYDDPDSFYDAHGPNFSGIRGLIFAGLIRRILNARVVRIRGGDGAAVITGRLP